MKMSAEAKVGLFVLLGIALLVYMSLKVGGFQFGGAEGYRLYVSFDSAAGLDQNSSVRVAGVEIGRVKEILLKDNKAQLVLEIKEGIKVGRDFTALLTTKGLLGEKYLELIPGAPGAPALKDGDEITNTTSYADMDKLITVLTDVSVDIKEVTGSLSSVIGGKDGEATLRNIINNIEELSFRVNSLVAKNDEKLGNVLTNLDEFSALLKNDGPAISSDIRAAIKNINDSLVKTSENLNLLVQENRGNLKEGVDNLKVASLSLNQAMENLNKVTKDVGPGLTETVGSLSSITRKIDKGEGTLGRLINDPIMHENINKTVTGINNYLTKAESFRMYLGYRSEYLFDASDAKGYFSLKIQPKADKYYLFEIVDDPRGKRKKETREITTGGTTTTQTETKVSDAIKFSAQIAKRFKNLVVRGGIIESTGGAGVDYYLFKDRFKLSGEAFDLNKKGKAHLKAYATYYINKFFHLNAGIDDFVDKEFRSGFVGVGLQFEDDDLKYLLSSGGGAVTSAVK